jgi:hypothetical protein
METRTRCGARLRNRPGQTCRRWPLANGNGRCTLHGGKALVGPDSPTWKHGRYSKWLPKQMVRDVERDMADPYFRKMDLALSLYNRFMQEEATKAVRARNPERRAQHLKSFADLAVKRSKVLTEESRRERAAADVLSRAQAVRIMTAFAMAVRQAVETSAYVTNRNGLLGEIQANWRKVSGPMYWTASAAPSGTRAGQPATPAEGERMPAGKETPGEPTVGMEIGVDA